jgi:hypothetical protein
LWGRDFGGIRVFSPSTGEVFLSLPKAGAGKWLASEDVFISFYGMIVSHALGLRPGWYLADVQTGQTVYVNGSMRLTPISPDGRKVADAVVADGLRQREQLYIYDLLETDVRGYLLTHNLDVYHWPICFLTFRPTMLLDNPP